MLSLKRSERFFLSLPPGLNWSNNNSLLPKYKILEPAYMYAAISVKLVIQVKLFTRKENMISTSIVYFIYLSGTFLYKSQFDLMFTWLITWIYIFSYQGFPSQTLRIHKTSEEEIDHLHSSLPLSPAHKKLYTDMQLCMSDDYHIFLIAPLVITGLLLLMRFTTLENYHLIDDNF